MLDLGAIFKRLYDVCIDLAKNIGIAWNWLLNPQFFGFTFLGFDMGFTWTPIALISTTGILTLIVLWVIKGLVPAS